jgi:hypothetical protein
MSESGSNNIVCNLTSTGVTWLPSFLVVLMRPSSFLFAMDQCTKLVASVATLTSTSFALLRFLYGPVVIMVMRRQQRRTIIIVLS